MKFPNSMSTNTEDSENTLKSSNEYSYVMMFKSTFDRELFSKDFDMWSIRKQYEWINDNITTFFPNVPKSLLDFIPALYQPGDCNQLPPIPKWLDMDKYRRGQRFVCENFMSLFMAKILGYMQVFTFQEFIKPIIVTKRSSTPYTAFKRYISTMQRFISWYEGEPWVEGTPAYTDMQFARKMHLMIQSKLRELDHEQIENESKIAELWCPDRELFLKDFNAACPLEKDGQRPYVITSKSPYKPKGINNFDMAGIQWSLISLVLLCPQKIGLHNATDEDIEAFCHMWRCYGYYLGMDDKYNICRGSLEEIKQRTRDFSQYWILPNFKEVTPEWEHMMRCLIESLNYYPLLYMPFKTMALLATDTLNISMPHLYASMSYAEWIAYKSWRFLFGYVLKFSNFRVIANKVARKIFDQVRNFDQEKKAKLQRKSEKQLSNFSTMH